MKVATIIGTRPEIIRLSRAIPALDAHCEHILIHTGQNFDYELNDIFFDTLRLRKPDHFLDCGSKKYSASQTISNIISKTDELLRKIKPECVVILGDTNSCLSAIAAKKLRIPIFHIEAGNRCFDSRVPEETNRRIVDHISDVNITYSHISRECLIREGLPQDRIVVLGSPMLEVYQYYKNDIESSSILSHLGLTEKNYFVFSCHRDENLDGETKLEKLLQILNFLSDTYSLPVIVTTHPRLKSKIDRKLTAASSLIKFIKPIGLLDYIKLQSSSKCVISDSGGINEESLILGFNAVNMRETSERHEANEEGGAILTGMNTKRIETAVEYFMHCQCYNKYPRTPRPYLVDNFSDKLVRTIFSFTDYVRRYVYHDYA